MLVVAADLAGPVSSELLAAARAFSLPEGAASPFWRRPRSPGAVHERPHAEVPLELPRTLASDSDWIWASPAGHLELQRYLKTLAGNDLSSVTVQ